jgi:general stress protein CsbA
MMFVGLILMQILIFSVTTPKSHTHFIIQIVLFAVVDMAVGVYLFVSYQRKKKEIEFNRGC